MSTGIIFFLSLMITIPDTIVGYYNIIEIKAANIMHALAQKLTSLATIILLFKKTNRIY